MPETVFVKYVGKDVMVATPHCYVCGTYSNLIVDAEGFENWKDGMNIQRAFPNMSAADRERMMTGIHPECWDSIFTGGEDDE